MFSFIKDFKYVIILNFINLLAEFSFFLQINSFLFLFVLYNKFYIYDEN